MNHKNFDFTQIPDKTNDVIFLKSLKTMFLGHFWPFLTWWGFFPKYPALSHTTIYVYNSLSSGSDCWKYTKSCLKEHAKIFSKNSTTQENITILRLNQDKKESLFKRENFKPEIKPMIENLQNEYKQAKASNFYVNIRN